MISVKTVLGALAACALLSATSTTAQEPSTPAPCSAPEYRQFDFWIGQWEVQNPKGQVVGKNSITQRLDGCLLLEEWESVRGGKGLSINYYDDRDGTWTQTYRDSSGKIATWPDLKGGFRDGSMILESVPGDHPMSRWVWTRIDKNKVRQMAESSEDGGKTWTVVWDSYYVRH